MCGRFTETSKAEKLSKELKIPIARIPRTKPHYNIAPTQPVAVMVHEAGDEPYVGLFRWGLIPSWAKDPSIGNRMINARMETLKEKPSFKGPLKYRRCLVLADGFYEWKKEGNQKQPFYIRMKSEEVMTFAGLWSEWDYLGSPVRTCTIVTGPPNALMQTIHHRMPVIIPSSQRLFWIAPDNEDSSSVMPLLKPFDAGLMEAYPVSRTVNSPANNTAQCIQKLDL